MAVNLTKPNAMREYTPVHLKDEVIPTLRPVIEKVETARLPVVADNVSDVFKDIEKIEAELQNADADTQLAVIGELESAAMRLRHVRRASNSAEHKRKLKRAAIKFLVGAVECLIVLLFGSDMLQTFGGLWIFIASLTVISGVALIMESVFDTLKVVLNGGNMINFLKQ